MTTIDDLPTQRARLGPKGRVLLGLFLWGQMGLQIAALMFFWPEAVKKEGPWTRTFLTCPITQEVALIMSVAVLGAMGGSTHALGSFASFVGNRNLVRSWVWWYLLRAPIGVSLAIVIYFVVRGGLLVSTASAGDAINPYGLGALAALAGLCSESATAKLSELFETLFKTERPASKDPITVSGRPALLQSNPAKLPKGSPDTAITLTGSALQPDDLAAIGGDEVPVAFVSATEVQVTVPAKHLAQAGDVAINVRRAAKPDITSNVIKLVVA